jgi:hypothetical protein
MKNIVIALFLLISISAFGQMDTTKLLQSPEAMFQDLNTAGNFLSKGGSLGYPAVLLELAGTVVMLLPDLDGVNSPQETMYFGAAMVISGIVIHVISYIKIMKAGNILGGMKPADYGIGIKIPLN